MLDALYVEGDFIIKINDTIYFEEEYFSRGRSRSAAAPALSDSSPPGTGGPCFFPSVSAWLAGRSHATSVWRNFFRLETESQITFKSRKTWVFPCRLS